MLKIPKTKYCRKCKEAKPLEHFFGDKAKQDGKCSNCKSCQIKAKRLRGYKKINNEVPFDEMYQAQQGLCAICEQQVFVGKDTPQNMRACVDHCHLTGKIRGILCPKCNLGLGYFNDNSVLLEQACKYLNKNHK